MATRANNIMDNIDHSRTQERYAEYNVSDVFRRACILPGDVDQTKRQGMDENRANGAKTSHEVHNGTAISWNTYHTYKAACVPLAIYARQEFGIRDIRQLTPDTVGDYLRFAVDCEVKYSTFNKICSAVEKFCDCINVQTGNNLDFHAAIDDIRHIAKEILPSSDFVTRAYTDPDAIAAALPSEMQIAAELQYTCGLRISDACYVPASAWDGTKLTVENSKNGQTIQVTPSPELAAKITAAIDTNGKIAVNRDAYSYQLQKACQATGQEYHGSHGLRHNYAQCRMEELTGQGVTFNRALQTVSEDMGHHRPDITKVYLR